MDIKETENRRHDLLEELNRELNDAQIAAVLRKEEGAPDMVSALLDELGDGDLEILGDFYFRPLQTEEDAAQAFMCVITITDELPPERLPALYEAISYVNFNIPAGCFSVDKDHRFFCYILSTLLPVELEDALLFREMDLAVGNALAICDSYLGILTDVVNGDIGVDGVVEFLGGRAEDQ